MNRVAVIGWDGATFDLIRPWAAEGKLPNLARLMAHGVHGPLRSTLPPWSFQAWSSFLTGKNPGKHGVFDFFRTPPGTYDLEFVNAGHRRGGPSLWQVLGDAGRKVISVSIPGTFPPEPVNGVMISGFDFPGEGPGADVDARGMYPPELHDEICRNVGPYPIDPPILRPMRQGRYDLALERILETTRRQAAAARYLIAGRPWDCFMMVLGASDTAAHHFWQYGDPNSPFYLDRPELKDAILRIYQELDRQTGALLDLLPSGTTVLLVSDHGCGGVSDWVLFPNRWLEGKGLVRLRGRARSLLARAREACKQWGIAALPSWTQRLIYRNGCRALGRYEARVRYGILDWANTAAYFDENPYYPVLRVNLKGRQPRGIVEPGPQYEEVRDRLIRELESWRHPETGERIVEKAYRREEVYSGPYLEEAADVVVKWALHRGYNYGFRLSCTAPPGTWLRRVDATRPGGAHFPRKFSSHRDDAVLIAHGPGMRTGHPVEGARIIDLAPTILTLLDVPVPEDMDGRFLEEMFEDPRETPVVRRTKLDRATAGTNGSGVTSKTQLKGEAASPA